MFSKRYFKHPAISLIIMIHLCLGVQLVLGQESAGTWEDSATGLIWATKDNGEDVNWNQARNYCETLTLGGYEDWHLPTINELKSIYDKSLSKRYKAKGTIELESAAMWSADTNNSGDVWSLNFSYGGKSLSPTGGCGSTGRTLCVHRPVK